MTEEAGLSKAGEADLAQKHILERWVSKTVECRELKCTDLFEDLKNGSLLFNLCEVLSGTELKSFGRWSQGKMRIQIVANMTIVFKYLKSIETIKLGNIGPTDVVDGNVKLVLALVWVIMGHFAMVNLVEAGGANTDLSTLRRRLRHWLLTYSVAPLESPRFDTSGEAPYDVPNLTKALQDGKVLLSVLHHFALEACAHPEDRATGNAPQDLALALEELSTKFNVDTLLDPTAKLDERFTVPYLIQMVNKLHDAFGNEAAAAAAAAAGSDVVVVRCRPLTDSALDQPPSSDAAAAALKAAERELAAQAASNEQAEVSAAALSAKLRMLELDKERLEALVGQLEDELVGAKRGHSTSSCWPSSTSSGGGSPSPPPPLPASAPPPPPPGSSPSSSPTPSAGGALEEAVAQAEQRFSEVEGRHLARADDLEARLLKAETERAAESNRHLKAIKELSLQLEAATADASEALAEQGRLARVVKDEREAMAQRVRDQDSERRKLHNTIQELRGNVRVFARVRPFLPHEQAKLRVGEEPWLRVDPDGTSIHALVPTSTSSSSSSSNNTGGGGGSNEDSEGDATSFFDPDANEISHSFSFDRTFGVADDQAAVFLEVSEFVQSALDGFNVCLFSYGQTGSGKTHTMTGFPDGPERGIIPRAIEQVAKRRGQLEEAGWSFEMQISFIEIYCEQIRDLLAGSEADTADKQDSGVGAGSGANNKAKHKIVQNEYGQNVVTNVEMVPVDPADKGSISELMQHAASLRSVTATKMNAESSRSHSVFTLHLTADHAKQGITLHGQLNLVDLAGSERVEKSGVSGQALTEAKHINTSLSALAGVFLALGKKNAKHVPFRDSKLTELLHPALSANGKTLMMLNLSPQEGSTSESVSSLRFGTNVNSCELGKAKRVIKRKESGGGNALPPPPPQGREKHKSPTRTRAATAAPASSPARERSRSPLRSPPRDTSPADRRQSLTGGGGRGGARGGSPVRRLSSGGGRGGRGLVSPGGRGTTGGRASPPEKSSRRLSGTPEKD